MRAVTYTRLGDASVLEVTERPGLDARIDDLRESARCLVEDDAAAEPARASASTRQRSIRPLSVSS